MVVMVVMLMVVVLVGDLLHQLGGQGVAALHGGDDLGTGELGPGGGEDGGLAVLLPQQADGGVQLALVQVLGAGQQNGGGVLHLVVEEFTEVLHVDLGLGGVYHGDEAVQMQGGGLLLHLLHGGDHVGQLAHAGGLDDDAVGGVVVQHLLQGRAEVAHQGAADAAGVHLGDLHAGVLQKAAVNADLTELVFDEDDLLTLEGLVQQLLDEGGLAGPEEAGDNVDFGHRIRSFLKYPGVPLCPRPYGETGRKPGEWGYKFAGEIIPTAGGSETSGRTAAWRPPPGCRPGQAPGRGRTPPAR